MNSTISIQIVTYNSERVILDSLDAIYKQKSLSKFEVIIIDNHSEDRTVSKIAQHYPQVVIIQNSYNAGYAGGHNIGIKASNSDFVMTLNPDVILNPDYIQHVISNMLLDQTIGMAAGLLVRPGGKMIDSIGIQIKKNRRPFDVKQGEGTDQDFNKMYNFGPCGAAAIYRRKFINDMMIGSEFFDEDFFVYKEDVDICWRGKLLGWNSIFVPEAVAIHERGWKENGRNLIHKQVKIHSYKNRYLLMMKNDDFINAVVHLPWILAFELSAFAYFLLKEPYLLSSWVQVWKLAPKILRKRNLIMKKRKVSPKKLRNQFK